MFNHKASYACLGTPTASIWCREARKGKFGYWILADGMQFLVLNNLCIGSTQFCKGFCLLINNYNIHVTKLASKMDWELSIIHTKRLKDEIVWSWEWRQNNPVLGRNYLGTQMKWDWPWVVNFQTWVIDAWWVSEVHYAILSTFVNAWNLLYFF